MMRPALCLLGKVKTECAPGLMNEGWSGNWGKHFPADGSASSISHSKERLCLIASLTKSWRTCSPSEDSRAVWGLAERALGSHLDLSQFYRVMSLLL